MLFWHQCLLEFPMNGVCNWYGEYGDTRLPSLHRNYLTPGKCNLIKPAAMENWCHYRPKSKQSCYNEVFKVFKLHARRIVLRNIDYENQYRIDNTLDYQALPHCVLRMLICNHIRKLFIVQHVILYCIWLAYTYRLTCTYTLPAKSRCQ